MDLQPQAASELPYHRYTRYSVPVAYSVPAMKDSKRAWLSSFSRSSSLCEVKWWCKLAWPEIEKTETTRPNFQQQPCCSFDRNIINLTLTQSLQQELLHMCPRTLVLLPICNMNWDFREGGNDVPPPDVGNQVFQLYSSAFDAYQGKGDTCNLLVLWWQTTVETRHYGASRNAAQRPYTAACGQQAKLPSPSFT